MASKPKKNTPKQSNAWLDKLKRETKGETKMKKFFTSKNLAWTQFILICALIVAGVSFYLGAQYANTQKENVKAEATKLVTQVTQSKTE